MQRLRKVPAAMAIAALAALLTLGVTEPSRVEAENVKSSALIATGTIAARILTLTFVVERDSPAPVGGVVIATSVNFYDSDACVNDFIQRISVTITIPAGSRTSGVNTVVTDAFDAKTTVGEGNRLEGAGDWRAHIKGTANMQEFTASGADVRSETAAFLDDKPHICAVGGIVEELPDAAGTPLEADGSSGPSAGVLAAIVAGAVLAGAVSLGGAAWYARRRRT